MADEALQCLPRRCCAQAGALGRFRAQQEAHTLQRAHFLLLVARARAAASALATLAPVERG